MVDILGPASAPNAVTVRPIEYRTFSSLDTFFRDCSTEDADDGTDIQAAWLNDIIDVLRVSVRSNGATVADPTNKIVPEVGGDKNLLIKSMQHLVQRGLTNYAADTGSANNIVITLAPAAVEYKSGLLARTRLAATNTSRTIYASINGLGNKPVLRFDGSQPAVGELIAEAPLDLRYDGITDTLRIMSPSATAKGRTMLVWQTAGTYPWTCPAGVYRVRLRVKGGGGGGGSCILAGGNRYGGCGGGGGIAEGFYDVVPGTTYTVLVGAAGLGATGVGGGNGAPGGTSAFGSLLGATGGSEGLGQGAATLRGGLTGVGYGGQTNSGLGDGSTGGLLDSGNTQLSAPGVGGGPGGQAGAGSGNAGYPGRGPGGGGGGTSYSEIGSAGGNGAAGEVLLEY